MAKLPAFRSAFRERPCLVAVNAFFEWSGEKGHRLKWRITLRDEKVIMVSHDLNLAARYCDKLILLSEGSVLSAGSVPEVLTQDNVEKVFRIRSLVQYDERIDSYSLTILGTVSGNGG